jgi:hypothetical protein
MKRILFIFSAIAISSSLFSQTNSDALRFTQTYYGSTARFSGLAGAYGALGGDFSSLSLNPAGIGVYRASEFTFTPSLVKNSSSAKFLDQKNEDFKYNFNLGNLGFVYTSNSKSDQGWVSTSFGIGYNRTNDFNRDMVVSGNSSNSLIDLFVSNANNNNFRDYYEGLAYQAKLIDTAGGEYIKYNTSTNMFKQKTVQSSGSSGAYVLSFGANYGNKLYLGATMEVNRYYYSENSTYLEYNNTTPSSTNPLDYFNYYQDYTTHGAGFTFKLGAIYKPVEMLRIGLAFHTPTFYDLHDDVNYTIERQYVDNNEIYSGYQSVSRYGGYNYSFTTPMKAIGSVALNLGNIALLSADYEYIDYSTMKFSNDSYDYSTVNADIKNKFKSTGNLRTGAEIRLGTFSLRGGYALYGNPYKSSISSDYKQDNYSVSGGLGYRQKDFFVDAAYVYSVEKNKSAETMYNVDSTPAVVTTTGNKFLVTVGFRF